MFKDTRRNREPWTNCPLQLIMQSCSPTAPISIEATSVCRLECWMKAYDSRQELVAQKDTARACLLVLQQRPRLVKISIQHIVVVVLVQGLILCCGRTQPSTRWWERWWPSGKAVLARPFAMHTRNISLVRAGSLFLFWRRWTGPCGFCQPAVFPRVFFYFSIF